MAATLVTGATGLLGSNVVKALLARQREVRALVRDVERARAVLPPEAALAEGDVTDVASLGRAMDGCTVVYHAAGLPEQWVKDPDIFQRVNVEGTRNAVDAALEQGVERFVYTSTIDVFQAAKGQPYDESVLDPQPKGTAYERSKQEADQVVAQALDRGLPAVFTHPSGLYGPGPATSPGLNDFFCDLARGKVPMLLPGGVPVVYSEDVAAGHLLAEEHGDIGGRYILSESYQTLEQLAQAVCTRLGKKVPPMMPAWVARGVAVVGEAVANAVGRPPLIPKGQLHMLLWQARPQNTHAREALGWRPRPFAQGVEQALASLREQGRI